MSAYEFIRTEKANFPVAAMCKVMGVSRSAFYAWLERKPSERERQHEALLEQVQAVYSASKCRYGSPRVHRALRKQGMRVSRKSVARAMRESGLFARRKKHFKVTTNSRHTKRIAPNLLARDFEAERSLGDRREGCPDPFRLGVPSRYPRPVRSSGSGLGPLGVE